MGSIDQSPQQVQGIQLKVFVSSTSTHQPKFYTKKTIIFYFYHNQTMTQDNMPSDQ